MNKIILLGRLVRDPEIRYSNSANPTAIARYKLAVKREYSKEGQQDTDFIDCVAFGKSAELAEKWITKGKQILIAGTLQIRLYEDKEGNKRKATEVIIEKQYFVGSKSDTGETHPSAEGQSNNGFYPINESLEDEDLPF